MPVVRWRFDDPVDLTSYTFAINPNEGGSPGFQKNFQYMTTAAEDGQTLVFEGRDQVQRIQFSGTLFTEAEHDAFVTWFNKRYQVQITDDLGREFSIVIESFIPKRVRARAFPWKHTYEVSAVVVDWPA